VVQVLAQTRVAAGWQAFTQRQPIAHGAWRPRQSRVKRNPPNNTSPLQVAVDIDQESYPGCSLRHLLRGPLSEVVQAAPRMLFLVNVDSPLQR